MSTPLPPTGEVVSAAIETLRNVNGHIETSYATLKIINVDPSSLLDDAFTKLDQFTRLILASWAEISNLDLIAKHNESLSKMLDDVNSAYETALSRLNKADEDISALFLEVSSDMASIDATLIQLRKRLENEQQLLSGHQTSRSDLVTAKVVLEGKLKATESRLKETRALYDEQEKVTKPADLSNRSLFWKIILTIGEGYDPPPMGDTSGFMKGPMQELKESAMLEMQSLDVQMKSLKGTIEGEKSKISELDANITACNDAITACTGLIISIGNTSAESGKINRALDTVKNTIIGIRKSSLDIHDHLAELKATSKGLLKVSLVRSFGSTVLKLLRLIPADLHLYGRVQFILSEFEDLPKTSSVRQVLEGDLLETRNWLNKELNSKLVKVAY